MSAGNIEKYESLLNDYIASNINDLFISTTIVNNNLIVRALSKNPLDLRNLFSKIWIFIRSEIKGLPPFLPKLWWV